MTGPYKAQRALAELPPEHTRPWILLQGVVLIEITWFLGGGVWLLLWEPFVPFLSGTRLSTIISLLAHGAVWVAVALVIRNLQARGLSALIGHPAQALADFIAVVKWSGGIALAIQVFYLIPFFGNREVMQPLGLWLLTLPVALIAVFIQTTAEELYFRGFIQSTLSARYARPMIWMVAPSVFFGLLHWSNGATQAESIQIVLYTSLFGLAASDLTARSGTLGAAIGFHFAHNAVLFLSYGALGQPDTGLALFLFPVDQLGAPAEDQFLTLDLAYWVLSLTVAWLAARNALRC